MLKISFLLKKPGANQGNLENITIDSPKKISEGKLTGMYACEVYLSDKKKSFPVCSINPADALLVVSEFVKIYLQGLINRGYEIREAENKEPWKLEKADVNLIAREKINKLEGLLKDDKSVSPKVKQELLENLRKMGGLRQSRSGESAAPPNN